MRRFQNLRSESDVFMKYLRDNVAIGGCCHRKIVQCIGDMEEWVGTLKIGLGSIDLQLAVVF